MLNVEGLSSEAKVGKILILVSLVVGILVFLILAVIGAAMYTSGVFAAFGVSLHVPLIAVGVLAALRILGLAVGFLALLATERRDFSRAGIFAIIACVLPPLDIVMLIGGIFCLISREANRERGERPPGSQTIPEI